MFDKSKITISLHQRLIGIYGITGAENIILKYKHDVIAIERHIQWIQVKNLIRSLPSKKVIIAVVLYVIIYLIMNTNLSDLDTDIITKTLGSEKIRDEN